MSLPHLISEQVVLAVADAAPIWVFVDQDHLHREGSVIHTDRGTS